MPISPLLLNADEVNSGYINHALRIVLPSYCAQYSKSSTVIDKPKKTPMSDQQPTLFYQQPIWVLCVITLPKQSDKY